MLNIPVWRYYSLWESLGGGDMYMLEDDFNDPDKVPDCATKCVGRSEPLQPTIS